MQDVDAGDSRQDAAVQSTFNFGKITALLEAADHWRKQLNAELGLRVARFCSGQWDRLPEATTASERAAFASSALQAVKRCSISRGSLAK